MTVNVRNEHGQVTSLLAVGESTEFSFIFKTGLFCDALIKKTVSF